MNRMLLNSMIFYNVGSSLEYVNAFVLCENWMKHYICAMFFCVLTDLCRLSHGAMLVGNFRCGIFITM